MAKEVMRRRASDNEYLHQDFHGALSCGIEYLHQKFGADAVREYLREFTRSFYAPLRADLLKRGLPALREHFGKLYETEGGEVEFESSGDELVLRVAACPAVQHLRAKDYPVARLFHETSETVNNVLCEGTPFAAELAEYDAETGRSVQRFYRRPA